MAANYITKIDRSGRFEINIQGVPKILKKKNNKKNKKTKKKKTKKKTNNIILL